VSLGTLRAMSSLLPQRRLRCWLFALSLLPGALNAQVNLLSTSFAAAGSGPRNVAVADLNGDGKADLVVANSLDGTISVLLSNGDGTFRPAVSYTIGSSGPNDVAIGDFNGDGKPDLAVTDTGVKGVFVLLGNGDGTFQLPVNYPTSDVTDDVVVADFNGDGNLDIAATDFSGGVSILLGNGNGTFQADRPFSTGTYADSLAVADFNGDGKPDLAVVNNNSENLTIFLGNGDGSFTQGATYTFSPDIMGVAVGDLNLDGKADLVLAIGDGSPQQAATVMLGNGDGTFAAPVNYGTALWATGVVVADFNGDGKPDVAITDQLTNSIVVLDGQGNGTLLPSFVYAAGVTPGGIADGDFNGDGNIDLATANYGSDDASTLLGKGDGTFRGARSYDYVTYEVSSSLLVLDVNHDGIPDAVLGGGSLAVQLGNGDGTFQPAVSLGIAQGLATGGLATADFNNDGNPDLAATTDISSDLDNDLVAVVLGNGNGTFQPEIDFSPYFLGPQYLVSGDFNGDGNPDLIITADGNALVSIALGNGTGSFQTQPILNSVGGGATATADFNRDGKPDFVAADTALVIFLGNGDGTFESTALTNGPTGNALTGVVAADLNGDGIPDVAVVDNQPGGPLSVLLGNGDGTFANPVNYPVGDYPQSIAVGDLNQDGHPDLVIALNSGRVVVLLGNGDGTFQPAINFGSAFTPGTAPGGYVAVAVADLNGDGYPDVLITNNLYVVPSTGIGYGLLTVLLNQGVSKPTASIVSLSSSLNPAASGQAVTLTATVASANGGATVPTGTVTFLDGSTSLGTATLAGGAAALSLSVLSVGNHNLTAAYSGNTTFAGNTSASLVQVVNANSFTVAPTGTGSASISPGQIAQYQLIVAPGTAQSQTISLSCSGAPPSSTCTLAPNPVILSSTSPANVMVTVQTTGPTSSLTAPVLPNRSRPMFLPVRWQPSAFAFAMLFSALLLTGANRKPRRAALGWLLGLLLLLAACGSNGGAGNTGGATQGTPPASYTIVVTAQSSAGTQQIKLALTVNP